MVTGFKVKYMFCYICVLNFDPLPIMTYEWLVNLIMA